MSNLRRGDLESFMTGFNSTILIVVPIFCLIYWNMANWLMNLVDDIYENNATYRKGIHIIDNVLQTIKIITPDDDDFTSNNAVNECHIPQHVGISDTNRLQTQEEVDQLV